VTRLDNVMYVVCGSSIRLYNTETQSRLGVININGMNHPWDIIVCRDDRQLYIADWRRIWRVAVDDQSYVVWLTTNDESFSCFSLSLTPHRQLLVTSVVPPRIRQYNTTNRQLLRVVSLPQYMYTWQLLHSVETTRGTLVVSHWGTAVDKRQWAVCELFVSTLHSQSYFSSGINFSFSFYNIVFM